MLAVAAEAGTGGGALEVAGALAAEEALLLEGLWSLRKLLDFLRKSRRNEGMTAQR